MFVVILNFDKDNNFIKLVKKKSHTAEIRDDDPAASDWDYRPLSTLASLVKAI